MSHKRGSERRIGANKTFVILRVLSGSWFLRSIVRLTRPLAIAVVPIGLAAVFTIAHAQKPAGASVTADLPTGPMQAKATTACLECHEGRIILQQRLSKAAWTKEVDKMTKWGALVDPTDRDALIDYLSANFSPDKPPYNPPRTSGSGKTSK
jgi:hypothetical protein